VSSESLNKKRHLDVQNSENFEIISKKEKPENNQVQIVNKNSQANNMMAKIVIKDGKVQIEAPQLESDNKTNNSSLEIVVNSKTKVTTSSSFKKGAHTKKWTDKETKKFYRVIKFHL